MMRIDVERRVDALIKQAAEMGGWSNVEEVFVNVTGKKVIVPSLMKFDKLRQLQYGLAVLVHSYALETDIPDEE